MRFFRKPVGDGTSTGGASPARAERASGAHRAPDPGVRRLGPSEDQSLHLLADLSRISTSSFEANEILPRALEQLCRSFGYERASYHALEGGSLSLRAEASSEGGTMTAGPPVPVEIGVAGNAARSGHAQLRGDLPGNGEGGIPEVQSALAVPVRILDRIVGVLQVVSRRKDAFVESDRGVVTMAADVIGRALHHSILYQELVSKNRELEQIDRRRTDFINMIAHDLKTPIHSIISYADLMLMYRDEPAEVREEFLMTIKTEAGRLGKLVEDFLDIARIESGTFQYVMETVDLADMVVHFSRIYKVQCDLQKVRWVVEAPASLPPVTGDKRRIGQVFSNILGNALKFTPPGGMIGLRVRAEEPAHPGDGPSIRVSISDTGPGIEAGDIARLFEKFTILAKTSRFRRGTGLGLPISKEIIERHGGRIWVDSTPGKGSVFHFVLPAAPPAGDSAPGGTGG